MVQECCYVLQIEQYLENQQQPDAAEVKAEDDDDEGENNDEDEEQEEPEPQ